MATARRARELGLALIKVGDNVNEARGLELEQSKIFYAIIPQLITAIVC